MKKIIKLLLILIIVGCFFIITYKYYLYYIDEKIYSEIQNIKPEVISEEINLNELDLLNINSDYNFWISIDNTNIDYPVVQYHNNSFYLKKNFYKEYSISGTLFVDFRNDVDKDQNIIIYGHNMRNGTMFSEINLFKEEEFFYNNNNITIIKDNKKYIYEVFSVYVEDEGKVIFKKFFKDNNDYLEYLELVSEKSIYPKVSDFDNFNNIITLVTCSYEYDNARTIVHAGLLEK